MNPSELCSFFLQLAVLLGAALVFGRLSRLLGMPSVIGEIAGGILVGKTLLGRISPETFSRLFSPGIAATSTDTLIRLGMLFFMFAAGFEINLGQMKGKIRSAVYTGVLGLIIPMALGFFTVLALPRLWGRGSEDFLFAVFVGSAVAISALPVIARILMDLGLAKTVPGTVILSAATMNDLLGWCLFTAVLGAMGKGSSGPSTVITAGVLLLSAAVLLLIGRFAGRVIRIRWGAILDSPAFFTGSVAVIALLVAAVLERAGLHPAFGAFLIGVVLAEVIGSDCIAHRSVAEFATGFFAPLYFASIGLRVDFSGNFDIVLVAVVLAMSCAGKTAGAWLGARLGGLDNRTSLAVGFGMNARGAIEIILANIALETGIIDQRLFVALVFMAVVTSVISAPILRHLLKREAMEAAGGRSATG